MFAWIKCWIKFLHAVYPVRLINISKFDKDKKQLFIPKSLFDENTLVVVRLLLAARYKKLSKCFIGNIETCSLVKSGLILFEIPR